MSLARTIHECAYEFSGLTALKIGERRITYGELDAQALSIAAALIEQGADREQVAIVGQRKPSSYIGILGTLYAGCSYTPINPKYSEARIVSILKDANIRFFIGSSDDLAAIASVIDSHTAGRSGAVIIPDGSAPAESNWVDEDSLCRVAPLLAPVDVQPESLAYILYTSGSTGQPKGVQVQHSNVLAFLSGMARHYRLPKGFRASQTFDLSFDPSVSDMFFTWANGGELCVLPENEMLMPSEFINREGITFWNSVPSVAAFMNRMGALVPGCFPDLKYSMFCGEQFPQSLADAWRRAAPNSTVENLYGPTEATIYISRYVYSPGQSSRQFRNSIIPIGNPFPDHNFALIDDAGVRLPNNEVGEIVYKGPQITMGYLNDREKTDSAFVTFPWDATGSRWYKSGDLGFFNEDGNLECLGRRDSQVKLGGRRVEIGEIEAVLRHYPPLRDAVVVPLRDENKVVTGLVAFATTGPSRQEENFIRSDSLKSLEKIFFPKKILMIESIPLSPSGKVDRKSLEKTAQALVEQEKK